MDDDEGRTTVRKKSYAVAKLLERVAYRLRAPRKITNIAGDVITAQDAFPYDPKSKTSPDTAKRWAESDQIVRCDKINKFAPKVVERTNEPFSVTIVDLDVRGHGGRAYKVIDSASRRFDLREDQLIEVFKLAGIAAGGAVMGEFVWGVSDGKVCLVLVGGDAHSEMVQGTLARKEADAARKANGTLTASKLVVGRVYKKRDGSLHLFMGKCKAPLFDRPQYAFVEMPTQPEAHDLAAWEGLPESDLREARARNEFLTTWESLSWRRRCKDQWVDKYKDPSSKKPYVHYAPYVFVAMPKFDSEVGVVEPSFFEEIRANAQGLHGYHRVSGRPSSHLTFDKSTRSSDLVFDWARENRDVISKAAVAAVDRGYWGVDEDVTVIKMYRDKIAWIE